MTQYAFGLIISKLFRNSIRAWHLTLCRLVIGMTIFPIYVVGGFLNSEYWLFWIFIVGAITDFIDGQIAFINKEWTKGTFFGDCFDSVADYVFVSGYFFIGADIFFDTNPVLYSLLMLSPVLLTIALIVKCFLSPINEPAKNYFFKWTGKYIFAGIVAFSFIDFRIVLFVQPYLIYIACFIFVMSIIHMFEIISRPSF